MPVMMMRASIAAVVHPASWPRTDSRNAQDNPGQLLCKGLENMREQVGELYCDEEVVDDKFAPVVNRSVGAPS